MVFDVQELTVEELKALPDLIGELALGCGYILCGACEKPQ
jgi:hypothetical protein